jgi:hypothetical protein
VCIEEGYFKGHEPVVPTLVFKSGKNSVDEVANVLAVINSLSTEALLVDLQNVFFV